MAKGTVSWAGLAAVGALTGVLVVGLHTSNAEGKPKKAKAKTSASSSASASASASAAAPKKGARKPRSGPCGTSESKCQGLGESCVDGACFCTEAGYARCGTEDDFGPNCARIDLDEDNCGACGKRCRDDQVCTNGKCGAMKCDPGDSPCRAGCRDLKTDDENCGVCDHACARDQGFTCSRGKCAR